MKELVRQQRHELYSIGHQNLNMVLSTETVARIDALKKLYRLRSRDAVVARIIRKCMATTKPEAFTQRSADPETQFRRISPIIPGELVDYVRGVQLRFRNLAYGPVFEMIFAQADAELSPAAAVAAASPANEFSARKHEPMPVAEAA